MGEAEDQRKKVKKLPDYNPEAEKKGLDIAHKIEQHKLPSAQKIVKEHKTLVQHEEDLKKLLKEEQIEDVEDLGTFKPGKGVEDIPRIKNSKKIKKKT